MTDRKEGYEENEQNEERKGKSDRRVEGCGVNKQRERDVEGLRGVWRSEIMGGGEGREGSVRVCHRKDFDSDLSP